MNLGYVLYELGGYSTEETEYGRTRSYDAETEHR